MCPIAPPPPKKGAPPPATSAPPTTGVPNGRFLVKTGRIVAPQKAVIYGPGGIGKSSLARLAPNPIFLDIESSTNRLDVPRIDANELVKWADLRACLQSTALDGYGTVVIDSVTKAEELAVEHTLATVKNDKGNAVTSIEGYGFGKGLQHVYDTFLHLLVDCDRHIRAGRNVVLIAHVCTSKVPNPMGEDFIRYEPRLQQTKGGNASIRNRVVEWSDHVLFVGYDVLSDDGKGKGGGTRTIYTKEQPTHIAKVRDVGAATEARQYENENDGAIWPLILGGAK